MTSTNQQIILLNGENPIRCEKALYYDDPFFMSKIIALSPTLQQYSGKTKLPTKDQLTIALSKGGLAVELMETD